VSAAPGFVSQLESTHRFFKTTLTTFTEEDSGFAPKPELYTVAGHVAHAADSVDWFLEGAFGKGWDMDFEELIARARGVTSLQEAVGWFDRAFTAAIAVIGEASDATLFAPIPDTRLMEGAPRCAIVSGITDHTAHHRGTLALYARLLDRVPPMPYA
jgi:uncharacterized damage-inducible protein DinB